ncbi:MAG: helix-turn-helix transcriptional regulator [Chloroflexota bacterium]
MRFDRYLDLIIRKEAPPNRLTRGMGALVRQARFDVGMTQAELADALELSVKTIGSLENGGREASVGELVMLCRVLRKPLQYFIPDPHRRLVEPDALSFMEFDLLMLFNRLDDDDRCKVLAQLRGLVEWLQQKPAEAVDPM